MSELKKIRKISKNYLTHTNTTNIMFGIGKLVGFVATICTFPGVIVHEIAHRFFCDVTKTPVYEIKYLQIDDLNTAGYVKHGPTKGLMSTALVCLGPLIINTLLCIIFSMPYNIASAAKVEEVIGVPHQILLWLGFSIGAHALPSAIDVQALSEYIEKNSTPLVKILYFPVSLLFFITRILSYFWFDFIFSFILIAISRDFFVYIFKMLY